MSMYDFKKDSRGWYIDLKRSPFNRAQKGMVRGADTLLDMFANGKSKVRVEATTFSLDGYDRLERTSFVKAGLKGANYIAENYRGKKIQHNLWLCPVTLWVFLWYPKYIYYKIIPE